MNDYEFTPVFFSVLIERNCVDKSDILFTNDGFYILYKSLSDILKAGKVNVFPDSDGEIHECDKFFDDWFLYAVKAENECVYGLFKMREQEYDMDYIEGADGDTPGVTISFISFDTNILYDCLNVSDFVSRQKLNREINRVVGHKNQRHHKLLKKYFKNPKSEASYTIALLYTKQIASFAENGFIEVPVGYSKIYKKSKEHKKNKKIRRIPDFIDYVNKRAGYVVCDHEKIFINDKFSLSDYEKAVILATHSGNLSLTSFAAEVEYHARYLIPVLRMKIPFISKSIYESAIRADMTIDDTEFEGSAPFYRSGSLIVRRQLKYHRKFVWRKLYE